MNEKTYEKGFALGTKHEREGRGVFVAGPNGYVKGYMDGRLRERGKKECPARAGDPFNFACDKAADRFCPYAATPVMDEHWQHPDCPFADWEHLDIARFEQRAARLVIKPNLKPGETPDPNWGIFQSGKKE